LEAFVCLARSQAAGEATKQRDKATDSENMNLFAEIFKKF